MPKKRMTKPMSERKRHKGSPCLPVLAFCFVCGAVCGGALAFFREPSEALHTYLAEYLSEVHTGMSPPFWRVFWDCVRWPATVLLLGTTVLGVVAVPGLFLVRGFILSYTAASFGTLLGRDGVLTAMALFSVTAVLVLPMLFLLGCESLRRAVARYREPGNLIQHWKPELLATSAGMLVTAMTLQYAVVPVLLGAVATGLF